MIKQIMISAILVLLVATKGDAVVAAGDNTATAGALCEILALGGGRSLLAQAKASYNGAHHEILDLNMSLAGENWRSVFEESGKKGTYPAAKPQRYDTNKDWDTKWKEWSQTAQRLKDADGIQQKLKEHKLHSRTVQHLAVAKQAVLQLADEQSKLAAELQRIKDTKKILANDQLKAKINTALYGEDVDTENTLTPTKVFDATAGSDRKGNCDGAAKGNKAKTVMAALVCLCAEDSSNGLDGACSKQLTLTNQWTSNSQPSNVLMQELRKLCPKSAPKTLTADRLAGIISNIKAHFIGVPTATVLGKLDTGADCSGSANSGLCLKYTDVHLGSTNTVDDISWIAALNQIVSDIKRHEETVAAADNIGRKLAANTEKAGAFIASTRAVHAGTSSSSKQQRIPTPHRLRKTIKMQKMLAPNTGLNTSCTNEGCKWDGTEETKGKCKPKDGKDRKLKEQERELQKQMPKAKSAPKRQSKRNAKMTANGKIANAKIPFLVNKQFAFSMVSAAFVALLF
uniref:Variant surface glycoprotein 1125.4119 n=1 Tax=Trypanosoma brucei TaxID=5691 RepID=A0A1J0RAA9_9TRYP|nr:variant surface glycoprotein 1125.4119 [Trypanosoma brucei]